MIITLFNMGFWKSAFATYAFVKLIFCLSALFVFSAVFCVEFDVILVNFYNIYTIIVFIVGVRYSVFLFWIIRDTF